MIQIQSGELPPSNQFSLEINLTNNNSNNNNSLYFQENISLVDKFDIFKCLSSPKNSVKNTEFNFPNNFSNNDLEEDENLQELFDNQSEHQFQQSFCFQNTEKTQQTQKEQKFQHPDIELHPNNEEDFIDPNGAFFEFPDFDEHDKEQNSYVNPKQENEENQQNQQKQQQIWKVTQSISKKKKQRDYDKNICRYIARSIVRCFVDRTYTSEVMEFCRQFLEEQGQNTPQNVEKMYISATKFLLSKIEFITGHRAFRSILCFDEDADKKSEKCVFRKFTYWFLKERAFRYIMTGAMSDKKSYLKFKNEIMMIYVQKPENWDSNLKIKRTR